MRTTDVTTIGHSLKWENRCLYTRLGCNRFQGGDVGQVLVTTTAAAIILGILVSWGAVYGLNRYLGPGAEPYETTGTLRASHPSD
jgi:hypothetical protein